MNALPTVSPECGVLCLVLLAGQLLLDMVNCAYKRRASGPCCRRNPTVRRQGEVPAEELNPCFTLAD